MSAFGSRPYDGQAPTCNDGCDPDGVKSQALDVVELRLKTFERATTVVSKIAACATTGVAAAASNTICEDEVYAA
jgi:hypothetical protein